MENLTKYENDLEKLINLGTDIATELTRLC